MIRAGKRAILTHPHKDRAVFDCRACEHKPRIIHRDRATDDVDPRPGMFSIFPQQRMLHRRPAFRSPRKSVFVMRYFYRNLYSKSKRVGDKRPDTPWRDL